MVRLLFAMGLKQTGSEITNLPCGLMVLRVQPPHREAKIYTRSRRQVRANVFRPRDTLCLAGKHLKKSKTRNMLLTCIKSQ